MVEGKAGTRAGRDGYQEREGRRIGCRWPSREMLGQGSTDGGGTEIRRQNEDNTGTERSAGRQESQVEVKVDALQRQGGTKCRAGWGQSAGNRKAIGTVGRAVAQG